MSNTNLIKNWNFNNTYVDLPNSLYSKCNPIAVNNPKLICFNHSLAKSIDLDFLIGHSKTKEFLSGNLIPDDAYPIAQAYAGHQFGHFTKLGDGRAIILGEVLNKKKQRFDIQLKGSGRTPFSRNGDGRATLSSMLREFLFSEAMYHLRIPTTRSLSVVATGEKVYRNEIQDGGVLTRIASSHIRIGTFEYVSSFCNSDELKTLLNYVINRHYPELLKSENYALELLKIVQKKQIDLIVEWIRVGFIHGVMNTDNMSIAGETIDYGPCAFMNFYDRSTCFSSIDRQGRYAFGNQPQIALWNLSIFANSLLPLISKNQKESIDLAKSILDSFQDSFNQKWYNMMKNKLGLFDDKEEYLLLIDNLIKIIDELNLDYNNTFYDLSQSVHNSPLNENEKFNNWKDQFLHFKKIENRKTESIKLMNNNNPSIIPRNHVVEDVLNESVNGDFEPFKKFLNLLSSPYQKNEIGDYYKFPKAEFDKTYQTFCGT